MKSSYLHLQEKYTDLLRQHIGHSGTIYFYWKGRVALYALLKSMGVGQGDEVILPAFTCVVVPNAILYLGAIPVYVDIEKSSFNTSLQKIQQAVTAKTKVIICQNTFGLSTDVDIISEYARKKNIFTIEDCTHGFGGNYNTKPNGTWCDAAFYSTQWNKPFSTGIGGIALLNKNELKHKVEEINRTLILPSFKEEKMLSALLFARKNFMGVSTYWTFLKIYRWLSKNKVVIGSSGGDEISGTSMSADYFKAAAHVQLKEGIKSIENLPILLKKRKENAAEYSNFLKDKGKTYVNEKWSINHSFLKYPVLVNDREAFILKAEKEQIELGEWFCSPLHPVPESELNKWNMKKEDYPVALAVSRQILNLPTDTTQLEKVKKFLWQNLDSIL